MDKVETEFLKTQRYIDGIFFVWTHVKKNLKVFLEDVNKFQPNLT